MLSFILVIVFILISAALVWFLKSHDHGQKEPAAALWLAAACGLGGGILASLIESHLIPVADLLPGAASGTMLVSSLGVGVIEECLKFIPLSLLIYGKSYFNEHTDGIIYFAVAGLGFGLPENILYTVQFGSKAGLGRLLLTPIFHAATTALAGYFLAVKKVDGKPLYMVIGALIAAIMLHGAYDFGLSVGSIGLAGLSVLITLTLSGGLFYLYTKAGEKDQDLGLATVGHNNFCRSCGSTNPNHHLYCTHCGKIA